MDNSGKIRYSLACLAILFLSFVCYSAFRNISDPISYDDIPYNSLVSSSVNILLDQSRSGLQIGLVTAGLLWGLLLAKPGEARIVFSDKPEIVLLFCSSVLLSLSFFLHAAYVERVASAYASAGSISKGAEDLSVPNVFSAGFTNIYDLQFLSLISGILTAALTLLSAHRLKRKHLQ